MFKANSNDPPGVAVDALSLKRRDQCSYKKDVKRKKVKTDFLKIFTFKKI